MKINHFEKGELKVLSVLNKESLSLICTLLKFNYISKRKEHFFLSSNRIEESGIEESN